MKQYIKGNFKRTIYNNESGYKVGLFRVKETSEELIDLCNRTITFTGYFHELNEDDTYIFNGTLLEHSKYGEQFNVSEYERCLPEERDSIVEFLSSGIFKGIGERTAEKIVDRLGNNTLTIILENPSNLLLIPTVTKKQIDVLHNTLIDYEASYNTILLLNELGFITKDSMLIYNKYKQNTKNVIEENLYQVAEDINELTFKKVDSIALKYNYERLDMRRIKSAIVFTIDEICNLLGHSYLYIEELFNYTKQYLGDNIKEELFIDSLNSLILELKIVKEDEKYYLKAMWDAEENIVKRIKYLLCKEDNKYKCIDKFVKLLEEEKDITYNEEQLLAVKNAVIKNFLIITGGPGTGKTTIIKAITELYKNMNKLSYNDLVKDIALLAPTGRASKRLSEKSLLPAATIHSFLRWNKESNKFAINEYNKSDVKLVIVDEASMIDVYLFNSLLKGLSVDTKIIIVGDYNQLPSVGPGELLKDLIESNVCNVINLKYLYRQQEGSTIIDLAYDINSGIINENLFNNEKDLFFIEEKNNTVEEIKKICLQYKKIDYKEFQILVPMYKGINGIDNINKEIQEIYNPRSSSKKELIVGEITYRENDKVLQLVNMPDEKIFNGDIGIIEKIDKKEIIINFDGNSVKFTPSNYHKFKHGYAISIHKSQGSEFDTVVMPIVSAYSKMLYRKLYYTAVTRAKNKLYIVGDMNVLNYASTNNKDDIRKTSIKYKLIEKINLANSFS